MDEGCADLKARECIPVLVVTGQTQAGSCIIHTYLKGKINKCAGGCSLHMWRLSEQRCGYRMRNEWGVCLQALIEQLGLRTDADAT